jgi:long-chain-fatty-acid--CoA ligase ACSBG
MGCCSSREEKRQLRGKNHAAEDDYFHYGEAKGPFFTCDATKTMPPRVSKGEESVGGEKKCPPATVIQILMKAAESKGDKDMFKIERPIPEVPTEGENKGVVPPAMAKEEWTNWTYQEALVETRAAAKGMIKLGFQRFDTVNVWGFNSPEWCLAAFASNFAGGKVGGLYPTDTPDTAAYKVVHSGGSIVVVEERGKLDKLVKGLAARGDCKRVKAVVAYGFEPGDDETVTIQGCGAVPLISWKKLVAIGNDEKDDEMESRMAATEPGHCAGLIYTSGTTGEPKAVMISHDNIIFESVNVCELLVHSCGLGLDDREERILSYLPLSHVAGMMVDIVTPIVVSATLPGHVTVYFARNYDLKAGTIKDRLCLARPTLFLGVPLVWEKIADKIRAIGASTTGAKKAIADSAKNAALTAARDAQHGGPGGKPFGHGAAMSVLGKIKENLGLDQCIFGFTGAAPIRVDTLEYFGSLGLSINEVYGMSECTGACTWSLQEMHLWGSCGFEMPSVEVRAFLVDPSDINKKTEVEHAPTVDDIDEKYMGELCFRGRNIMMGYMANPDLGDAHVKEIQKKTAETIDGEGWLHSGDKGMITVAGMVKITGRYKELIIGEGGENIAPVPIEDHIKKSCDGIAEVMMVGDKRKYNIALVTLKAQGANGEVPGTDNLDAGALRVNSEVKTISGAMKDQVWIDTVTKAIESANKNGKCCPNAAFTVQKFTILPTNFSEEGNELTPTKKLKRAVVTKAYADLIDRIYKEEGKGYIPFNPPSPEPAAA